MKISDSTSDRRKLARAKEKQERKEGKFRQDGMRKE